MYGIRKPKAASSQRSPSSPGWLENSSAVQPGMQVACSCRNVQRGWLAAHHHDLDSTILQDPMTPDQPGIPGTQSQLDGARAELHDGIRRGLFQGGRQSC